MCARRTSKLWIELKVVVEASITLWVMFSCYFAWLPLRHVRMWRSGGSGERPFKFSLLLFRFSWFLMHSSSDTVGDTKRYILKSTHCYSSLKPGSFEPIENQASLLTFLRYLLSYRRFSEVFCSLHKVIQLWLFLLQLAKYILGKRRRKNGYCIVCLYHLNKRGAVVAHLQEGEGVTV